MKALDRLIEAFANGCRVEGERCREWVLRLVGPDQAGHMAELMSLCDRLGLSYSTPEGKVVHHSTPTPNTYTSNSTSVEVEFAGPKFGDDLEREYELCDCLALVSHTENFGATIVDAMAHGKPVIASTKTPWKLVAERGCGWWADNDVEALSAALSELLNLSTSELLLMGAYGRKLVEEQFTWGSVARAVQKAYEANEAGENTKNMV